MKYRVDFFIPSKKVVVELDGHDFHSSPSQREYDAKRDRYLGKKGFRVVRFTGREINRDVDSCVLELIDLCRTLPGHTREDLSDRDISNSNPDNFSNPTYYCSYMQKVANFIFSKHGIKNLEGAYIKLRQEGYDDLSIGVDEGSKIYASYSFSVNGDRAVSPEFVMYRYFDIETGQYELIPFSYSHFTGFYQKYLEFDKRGRFHIVGQDEILSAANHIETMARGIEFHGFLAADAVEISPGYNEEIG